jgi:hypothetical protein
MNNIEYFVVSAGISYAVLSLLHIGHHASTTDKRKPVGNILPSSMEPSNSGTY